MEDQATRFFFGWLPNEDYVGVFVLVLFLILVAAIIAGSYYYITIRETAKNIFDLRNITRSPRGTQYEPLTDEMTTEDQAITDDQITTDDQATIEDEVTEDQTTTEDQGTPKHQAATND
ncbi:uncharacterized protein LOC143303467 [Bombus vancouverensis nearcticus]|uniref:uncharacterized protein LOC143303467 n=1 Tax=Bombus vancouverensis nearcticus TaxID=2705178 RepID=UPI00402BC0C2